ncbi:MAG: DUF3379 family protein [Betaproteobacteria bacterium]
MNCLEFRRLALAGPRPLKPAAAAHAKGCEGCREFLARTLDDEAALEAALRVPVPRGLDARLLERPGATLRALRVLALAASLLLAAGISLLILTSRPDPLAMASIEFVVYEEAQTIVDAKPTDWHALVRVARGMGVSLPRQLGDMRYICVYPVAGQPAHHLVVATPLGKLTLLLVPERQVAARAVAAAHGLEAAIVPAARGFIAIVGPSPRSVARAEALLRAPVDHPFFVSSSPITSRSPLRM